MASRPPSHRAATRGRVSPTRQAIVLLKSADTEVQNRPPKPHAPPPAVDGGSPISFVRTSIPVSQGCSCARKSVDHSAAVAHPAVACRARDGTVPGEGPSDTTADRIAIIGRDARAGGTHPQHVGALGRRRRAARPGTAWRAAGESPVCPRPSHRRVALNSRQAGLGNDDDVEEILPAIPVPTAVPRPPAQPLGRGPRGRAVRPGNCPRCKHDIGITVRARSCLDEVCQG